MMKATELIVLDGNLETTMIVVIEPMGATRGATVTENADMTDATDENHEMLPGRTAVVITMTQMITTTADVPADMEARRRTGSTCTI